MKKYVYTILMFMCFSALSVETIGNNAGANQTEIKLKPTIMGNRKPKTKSDKAIAQIEKIVLSFIKDGRDIAESSVQNSILQQVSSIYPLDKSVKVEEVNLPAIEKKAELEAKIKYPFTRKELKKKYKLEAESKFKAQPQNSKITVKYKQGANIYKVSGVYNGYTRDYDGIYIGRTIVPIVDLLAEDKVKFDKNYRERRIGEYINESIAKDLAFRGDYVVRRIKEEIDAIVSKSENAGYILAWNKWRSPEEVTEIIMKYYSHE